MSWFDGDEYVIASRLSNLDTLSANLFRLSSIKERDERMYRMKKEVLLNK